MYNSYFQWHKPKECEHAKNFLTSSEGVCVHCVASSIQVNRMCNNNWTEWCFLSCLSTYFLHFLTMLTQTKLFHHHLLIFLPFQMAFVWDAQTKFQLLLFFFCLPSCNWASKTVRMEALPAHTLDWNMMGVF